MLKLKTMNSVEPYIAHFTNLWEKSPTHLPVFNRVYSDTEKQDREHYFEELQLKMESLQKQSNLRKLRKSKPENTFFPVFKTLMQNVFDFEEEQLKIILSEDFRNVSKDFFYQARAFGPELSPENIYQALRNVWIMNGLQLMMHLPVEITPSVFAYSMIYPYSDNLLDDPLITDTEKLEFSERFNRRLHGENVVAATFTESQLFKLVGMFEQQYNRHEFPDVYKGLFAIQKAQTDSMKLLKSGDLPAAQIQQICFEKGGASVLADGFLVAGNLTREQQQALFGYGVYLQMLDDIQDANEDREATTKTMCSYIEGRKMDEFVNRTIHFGRVALDELKCFEETDNKVFLSLMSKSIETMAIESVGVNSSLFSDEFSSEIEKYSPLHFAFIRQKKSQSKSQRFSLFRKYFDQATPERIKSVLVNQHK
jgi:hypothetical protein